MSRRRKRKQRRMELKRLLKTNLHGEDWRRTTTYRIAFRRIHRREQKICFIRALEHFGEKLWLS